MKNFNVTIILPVILSVVLGACTPASIVKRNDEIDKKIDAEISKNQLSLEALNAANPKEVLLEYKRGPWVGSRSVSLDHKVQLPAIFYTPISFRTDDPLSITDIAERISNISMLRVVISSDLYEAQSSGSTVSSTTPTGVTAGGGTGGGISFSQSMGVNSGQNKPLLYDLNNIVITGFRDGQTLVDLLDSLYIKSGVTWTLRDKTIVLSRYITKTFFLTLIPGNNVYSSNTALSSGSTISGSSVNSGIGNQSSQANQSGSSAQSSNSGTNNASEYKFNAWSDIQTQLRAIMSNSGKLAISQSTGAVTITDTPSVIEHAEQIVTATNEVLTKQTVFHIQVVSIQNSDSNTFGINWELLYSKLAKRSFGNNITFKSPAGTNPVNSGTLSYTIASGTGNSDINSLDKSQAILAALSETAKTVVYTNTVSVSLNRQSIPISNLRTTTYLAQTTAGTSSTVGGATTPGLTQGSVQFGLVMNVIPVILPNNKVLVNFWLNSSSLIKMGVATSGSGANMQSVQTPETSQTQNANSAILTPGETLIISGLDSSTDQYDKRTLGEELPVGLGGVNSTSNTRSSLVVMITPIRIGQ